MNNHGGTTNLPEAERRHDTSANSVGMDRLGGEHKVLAVLEVRIDVATKAVKIRKH